MQGRSRGWWWRARQAAAGGRSGGRRGARHGGGAPALCTGRDCFPGDMDSLQVLEQITLILFGFYKGLLPVWLCGREGGRERERQEGKKGGKRARDGQAPSRWDSSPAVAIQAVHAGGLERGGGSGQFWIFFFH